MSWRFRQSFKVIPGVRLNLSKSGLSCSIGTAPFTLNVGQHGVYGTASLPGTGISYRQRLAGVAEPADSQTVVAPPLSLPETTATPTYVSPPIHEVHSGSTELLTSTSLKELKTLIQTAFEEHADISDQLQGAEREEASKRRRYDSWANGFMLKRVFKENFQRRQEAKQDAEAKVSELKEQLRLTAIATTVNIDREQAEPYYKMRDDFASLCESVAIWDIKAYRATDKFHERTIADQTVDRIKVEFALGSCDLIQWDQKVPHLQNAKGGDLFLYPGFILYRAAKQAFSVIAFRDVSRDAKTVHFHEEDAIPRDAKIVGQTWAKANKDGTRDKRFVNNYQIPIVAYASLSLKSDTGLWEEFQFSNPERLERFLESWDKFTESFVETSDKT